MRVQNAMAYVDDSPDESRSLVDNHAIGLCRSQMSLCGLGMAESRPKFNQNIRRR
jgi:hypothetical protein